LKTASKANSTVGALKKRNKRQKKIEFESGKQKSDFSNFTSKTHVSNMLAT
jgi:hypothetical protein